MWLFAHYSRFLNGIAPPLVSKNGSEGRDPLVAKGMIEVIFR